MFTQISTFFSDLKISLKSMNNGNGSGKRKDGGSYNKRRSDGRRRGGGRYDEDDDEEDQVVPRGCLSRRSVSMEWGPSGGSLSSRKNRTTSTESLDPRSSAEQYRSAQSLTDIPLGGVATSRGASGHGGLWDCADGRSSGGERLNMASAPSSNHGTNGYNKPLIDLKGAERSRAKQQAKSAAKQHRRSHSLVFGRSKEANTTGSSSSTGGSISEPLRQSEPPHKGSSVSLQIPPTTGKSSSTGLQKGRRNKTEAARTTENGAVSNGSLKKPSSKTKSTSKSSAVLNLDKIESAPVVLQPRTRPRPRPAPAASQQIEMGWGIQTAPTDWAPANTAPTASTVDSTDQVAEFGSANSSANNELTPTQPPSSSATTAAAARQKTAAATASSAHSDLEWARWQANSALSSRVDRKAVGSSPAVGRSRGSRLRLGATAAANTDEVDASEAGEPGPLDRTHQSILGSTMTIDRCIAADNGLQPNVVSKPAVYPQLVNITEQTTNGNSSIASFSQLIEAPASSQSQNVDNRSAAGVYGHVTVAAAPAATAATSAASRTAAVSGKHNLLQGLVNNVYAERVQQVKDSRTGTTYVKGKLLGKGGFAKCYELTDVRTGITYAGKIIPKSRLAKGNQMEKILREVELHRDLDHKNVVRFHSYFEDDNNVYIVLENCSRKSLVHMLKYRKTLTEPEVRYYMHHLFNGVGYTHSHHIVHRDLKLGNLLLNEAMDPKIADFGLATRIEYEGERKMTVCGTPNYIAPEVLQKRGHSYEADIWAMGCVMYALLCGRPPFETMTLKETYMRIVTNRFAVPPHVSMSARNLIQRLLTLDPERRPTLHQIAADDFFVAGFLPPTLSTSTCEVAPKFTVSQVLQRPKVTPPAANSGSAGHTNAAAAADAKKASLALAQTKNSRKSASQIITRMKTPDFESPCSLLESHCQQGGSAPSIQNDQLHDIASLPMNSAIRLNHQLILCLESATPQLNSSFAKVQRTRTVCVTKWVDYSNKYGFGFQLSNGSVGILFNDNTRMLLAADGQAIHYNDLNNKFATFSTTSAPPEQQKKVTLLNYFAQYMETHLIPGGNLVASDRAATSIFMKKWFRTDKAIVMYLTDGTLQVNFLDDHTKLILNPDGPDYLLTVVDRSRDAASYPLTALRNFGCTANILERLRYCSRMLDRIISGEEDETVRRG